MEQSVSHPAKYEGRITGFFVLFIGVVIAVAVLCVIYISIVRANPFARPDPRAVTGFLGSRGSLASDLSLLGYIVILVPAMLLGASYARRQKFGSHKLIMTAVTTINWIAILYLMGVKYNGSATFFVTDDPFAVANRVHLYIASIHLLTGLIAQILATVSLIRMWFENSLPSFLRYEPIKPQMILTLALWLITAVFGITTYVIWYVIPLTNP